MIGSMAPDFGYFFSHDVSRQLTHSFSGLFLFALPAGLSVWLFYVYVLEKATITLLSDRWHTRFAHTDTVTPRLVARSVLAIVLGALTHILWDAFTHRDTFLTSSVAFLNAPTPGFPWLPVYHLLHGLSTVVGLVILAYWARHLHRQPAKSLIRPYRVSNQALTWARWFLLVVTLAAGLAQWLPYARARYDAQAFSLAVGSLSGFFVAWCCVAIAMQIHTRRRGDR